MEKKKSLKIDVDELCSAIEDNSYQHEYYLDLETGEILFLSEYMVNEERERRFQFKDGRIQERALEWLGDIDVSLIEE